MTAKGWLVYWTVLVFLLGALGFGIWAVAIYECCGDPVPLKVSPADLQETEEAIQQVQRSMEPGRSFLYRIKPTRAEGLALEYAYKAGLKTAPTSKYIDIMTLGDFERARGREVAEELANIEVWAVVLTGTIQADSEQDFNYMAIALDTQTGAILAAASALPDQPRPLPSRGDRCSGQTRYVLVTLTSNPPQYSGGCLDIG